MKRRFRPFLGLLLALVLALAGQGMAVARGMPDAAGVIELCTGAGPVSVSVDETGQPVGPPHICPDCVMTLFAFDAALPPMPARPQGRGVRPRLPGATGAVSFEGPAARARGPPAGAA